MVAEAQSMRCIMVERVGAFDIRRVPVPRPSEDEVTVKVEVTGLCRTDLKLIRSGHRDLVLPRIPGEEVVGVVSELGSRSTAGSVKEGDRVYVYPGIWCGGCPACLQGAENLCRAMKIMGFHRDGGFAEYVTVPVRSVMPVPDGLISEKAVFAEPLSCCLNALELARVGRGQTVGIWGAGPAGTLLARASRALGAEPFPIEPDERRRVLAGAASSPPDGILFDACIVAVGARQPYEQAITWLAPRGRLVVFSGLAPSEELLAVNLNRLHYHEQTVVGAYGCSYRHGRQALDLVASGDVRVEDMISHRMPLDDLQTALEIVETRKGMKVLLYP